MALILFVVVISGGCISKTERFHFQSEHMGTTFSIIVAAESADRDRVEVEVKKAFTRIRELDELLSDYKADSELSQLTRSTPGMPVRVSADLYHILESATQASIWSRGVFDITVGPLSRLWRRSRRMNELPTPERIQEARQRVGYKFIQLDPIKRTATVHREGMQLDPGGIAKGYAADAALESLRRGGFPAALVDAGGDIALGDPPQGEPGFKIGLPETRPGGGATATLVAADCGVASSGDTYRFVEIGGRRYSHILDVNTGLGLVNAGLVTIIARDAETADIWATVAEIVGPSGFDALPWREEGISARFVHFDNNSGEPIISWFESPR